MPIRATVAPPSHLDGNISLGRTFVNGTRPLAVVRALPATAIHPPNKCTAVCPSRAAVRAPLLLLATLVLTSACASRPQVGRRRAAGAAVARGPTIRRRSQPVNVTDLYRDMGLVAARGAIPYVGRVAFLPDRTTDSTLVLVSMSFAPRFLAFAREDDQYAGRYTVRLELRDGPNLVRQLEAEETVRVATFRETSRTDESLIWQQYVRVAPGPVHAGHRGA